MANINQFFKSYKSYNSTFKVTSFDNANNTYLCNDTTQNVINFDKIIENIYKDPYKRPKSFDALYQLNNDIYLIEFKNQKPTDIINSEVNQNL